MLNYVVFAASSYASRALIFNSVGEACHRSLVADDRSVLRACPTRAAPFNTRRPAAWVHTDVQTVPGRGSRVTLHQTEA